MHVFARQNSSNATIGTSTTWVTVNARHTQSMNQRKLLENRNVSGSTIAMRPPGRSMSIPRSKKASPICCSIGVVVGSHAPFVPRFHLRHVRRFSIAPTSGKTLSFDPKGGFVITMLNAFGVTSRFRSSVRPSHSRRSIVLALYACARPSPSSVRYALHSFTDTASLSTANKRSCAQRLFASDFARAVVPCFPSTVSNT